MIAPTNLAFHPAQLLGFAVNLAMLLYYKGQDLRTALPDAWLRDERARHHSDLLLLTSGEAPVCFIWSPVNRPFGQSLQYCSCERIGRSRWRHHITCQDRTDANKTYCQYKCTGCSSRLQMWLDSRQNFTICEALGTTYVTCTWPVPKVDISFEVDKPCVEPRMDMTP